MSLIAMVVAFLSNLALIPVVRWWSFRVGRVAQPRADRWHRQPTPTLGGVGIFAAFVISLLIGEALLPGSQWLEWRFLSGAALLFFVGIYDEFRPMSPAAKLVAQIIAGTLVISLGYTSTFFTPRIANLLVAQVPNILFTFLWLIGITNAINFLDNMDGLAGGISLITVAVLSYFFARAGDTSLLWVSLALVGSLLGFLVYNFPPAKIFMGDSGSLFLGFILATLAIAQQKQQASNVLAILAVPTLVFLLPILDTSLVTITRLMRGQSPAQGGRDHTSHRLIAFGLSERQTLAVLYGVAILSGVTAAVIESLNYYLSLALAPLLIVVLALMTAYLGGLKVVTASPTGQQRQTIARVMRSLTYRRRVLEVSLDFFLISLTYYLAFLARYGLVMNAARFELFLHTLPLALAGSYVAFYVFGVYRGVWRYVGLNDLVRYLEAALGSAALITVATLVAASLPGMAWAEHYSQLVLAFFAVFLFLGLAATRFSFRLLDSLAPRQPRQGEQAVLIFGAGDHGELALRWIWMNPDLNYRPLGFIDPDPLLTGRQIHGVSVLGGLDDLERILTRRPVAGVIVAGPAEDSEMDGVLDLRRLCRQHGCWVRHLRLELVVLEMTVDTAG